MYKLRMNAKDVRADRRRRQWPLTFSPSIASEEKGQTDSFIFKDVRDGRGCPSSGVVSEGVGERACIFPGNAASSGARGDRRDDSGVYIHVNDFLGGGCVPSRCVPCSMVTDFVQWDLKTRDFNAANRWRHQSGHSF